MSYSRSVKIQRNKQAFQIKLKCSTLFHFLDGPWSGTTSVVKQSNYLMSLVSMYIQDVAKEDLQQAKECFAKSIVNADRVSQLAMPCQLKRAHFQDFIEGMTAKLLSRFFDILCVNEAKVDCDVSCICNIDNPKMHMTATDAVLPRNLMLEYSLRLRCFSIWPKITHPTSNKP